MTESIDELKKQFTALTSDVALMKKDFELKLESAQRDVKQYKDLAEKREEDLRKFAEAKEESDRKAAEALAKSREGEIKEFAEAQVKAGRIIPALKDRVITFMKSLTSDKEIASFEEKDGSKRSHNQLSLFKELISKLKVTVPIATEYSESGTQAVEEFTDEPKEEKFMEVRIEGVVKKVPLQDADFAAKAFEYQEEQRKIGKIVSYEEALIAISPKNRKVAK